MQPWPHVRREFQLMDWLPRESSKLEFTGFGSVSSRSIFYVLLVCRLISGCRQFLLEVHDLLDLGQEPPVNLREIENLLDAEAGAQSVADEENPFGVRNAEFARDDLARKDIAVAVRLIANAPGLPVATHTRTANLERTQAFLQRFLERTANRHGFAHRFHLRVQRGVGLREFLE